MGTIASIFGYLLNWIYEIVKNYGLAIIIFSVVTKIIMLPLSIKQQKSMQKSAEMQGKVKELQKKYKDNPEQLNKETMKMYKDNNVSPFSGCLSAILQMVILLSMFFLIRQPLTHMKKIDAGIKDPKEGIIAKYEEEIKADSPDNKMTYPEIAIIKDANERIATENYMQTEETTNEETGEVTKKETARTKENVEKISMNMDFMGLDLSLVPSTALNNPVAYIIPVLYVISSFASMKITMSMQNKKKANTASGENKEVEAMEQANKSMMYLMPIMSISISFFAPLGLALYWLINNLLMIGERLIINKIILNEEKKEAEANAK